MKKLRLVMVLFASFAGSGSLVVGATAINQTAKTTVNTAPEPMDATALLAYTQSQLAKLDSQIAGMKNQIAQTNAKIKATKGPVDPNVTKGAELDMLALQSLISKRAALVQQVTNLMSQTSAEQKRAAATIGK